MVNSMELSSVSSSGTTVSSSNTASLESKIAALSRQISVIEGSGLDEDTIQSQVETLQSQIDSLQAQLSQARGSGDTGASMKAPPPANMANQAPGTDSSTTTKAQASTSTSLYEWYA
jgi:outer membrane murein-binding lipoprotein Lpp